VGTTISVKKEGSHRDAGTRRVAFVSMNARVWILYHCDGGVGGRVVVSCAMSAIVPCNVSVRVTFSVAVDHAIRLLPV
jgi:hypothetical protein